MQMLLDSVARWVPVSPMVLFKCCIYSALCYNGYLYILDDVYAARSLLNENSSWSEMLNIYAVTIDTIAWISLLVVFELETAVLEDETLVGVVKWALNIISVLCYIIIGYALLGYVGKLVMFSDTIPFVVNNVCDLVGTDMVITPHMDEYLAIDSANCGYLSGQALGHLVNQSILFEQQDYTRLFGLAVAGVVNSATWILVVIILQVEIVLQLHGNLHRHFFSVTRLVKGLFYLTLFLVAVYWGFYGDFIDFWDAALWLLGFAIIELNVFSWNQEAENEAKLSPV